MKRLVAGWLVVLLLGIIALGCEPPKKTAKSGPPAPPPLPPETKVGVFAGGLDDLARGPAAEAAQRDVAQPDDPNLERVKAGKGVGAKGRSLDEYKGIYVTPAKAYFAARERIFFEIEFKGNYDIWRQTVDRAPKDFDELKALFLDPMGLSAKLPSLPEGHKYLWDAATEQLLVERPRQQPQ